MLSRTQLLDPVVDHDACGVGFVAQIGARPSHETVERALEALRRLAHRGGMDADGYSGDGAGLLTGIPDAFMRRTAREQGINLPQEFAVGMVFLPRQSDTAARERIAGVAPQFGLACLGWRRVPVNESISGHRAVETLPLIEQCYFRAEPGVDFDRALFRLRKSVESTIAGLYFCSLSTRTIVYKGLLTPQQLPLFYGDLTDPEFESRFAIFHQRYSTNTQPSWSLAQPFRFVAHNGEINTIRGNRRWLRAREPRLRDEFEIAPDARLFEARVSDSSTFDNAFEVLLQRGDTAGEAMLSMVPPAWENDSLLDPGLRSFLGTRAAECEPWDGPAALIFSDGRVVGAKLDRNGLRPLRYTLTSDGWLIAGSETGIADLHDKHVEERQRLGPGQMLLLDLETGALHRPADTPPVRSQFVTAAPQRVAPAPQTSSELPENVAALMAALGWTEDQFKMLFQPLVQQGKEAVWSMGDDTPPAALSKLRRALWDYCKQRFAQVTNPAIDPFRETHVMSLDVYFGARNVLPSPLVDEEQLATLNTVAPPAHVVDFTFAVADGVAGAENAIERVHQDTARAAAKHRGFLLLSDRNTSKERAALPAMLAVAAAWKSSAESGAPHMPIVVETGQAFDTHHIAMLVAAGASAVHPWLAFAHAAKHEGGPANYRASVETGLRKVLARMGISAIASYRNSHLFETIGLDAELCAEFFENADFTLGGISLRELLTETVERHREAFSADAPLRDAGLYRFRQTGEQHASSPELVRRLHKFVKLPTGEHRQALEQLATEHEPVTIRDYLDIVPGEPISLQEVESEASVLSRFSTQAMSLGAISPEAHRTLAIAMNRLGARSNTGEGGEDPALYRDLREAANRVKQVASARFGVTAEYLSQADEIEIKISQGSKPGEGGQLPASKVTAYIARLRHAVPNMQLISPPPHHDIYSIEDLAQLIYDLRSINPRARIGVKLVSSAGVGIIAAGVAKAGANVITIAGHDGGTGASPLTSIKNTGMPWEIGLRETHATLLRTGLRGRVRLRADGGFKFARDVIIAALLGADEFGFGTAALLAIGCVMARQCHLNTCPVGVATQDEKLRTRFGGTPEMVENYFRGLAAEVRERLAAIGARSLEEIVGKVDLLRPRDEADSDWLRPLLDSRIEPGQQIPAFREIPGRLIRQLARTLGENDSFGSGRRRFVIANSDRAIGAHLSGELLRRRDEPMLDSGPREYEFIGAAGQSFGAFLVSGVNFRLIGQANDYVGKGLSGGSIAIAAGDEASNRGDVLAGNTVLYGATSGELYVAGRAGERFGVRNSGAFAVVEGLGQHGCEYMTGGIVLVLGTVGKNFGAGMTGGLAYVLRQRVPEHLLNAESVRLAEPEMPEELWLRWALQRHVQLTGSPVAEQLLQHDGPLPIARVEPLQAAATVAETWQAVLRRVQKPRQFPVDTISETTSPEPTLM